PIGRPPTALAGSSSGIPRATGPSSPAPARIPARSPYLGPWRWTRRETCTSLNTASRPGSSGATPRETGRSALTTSVTRPASHWFWGDKSNEDSALYRAGDRRAAQLLRWAAGAGGRGGESGHRGARPRVQPDRAGRRGHREAGRRLHVHRGTRLESRRLLVVH